MQVTRLSDIRQCDHIAAAWNCMARSVPFRRTSWLHSWWNHYWSSGDLFVLQVSDARGEIVGIAPWYVEHSLRHGRVIRPLGSGEICSDYLGILATPEHEQQVGMALAEWLVAAAQGAYGDENQWDLLDLVSVDAQEPLMLRFVWQLEAAGNHIHERRAMSCWRIALPDSWEGYLSLLSRSHRKRVRRVDRVWLETAATRLQCVTTHAELEYAINALVHLHQKRQQSLGHPGCFASSAFDGFLREAARRLLEEQTLNLYWIELDGEPLAAEFQVACGSTTYAYLGGMNPDKLEMSPGQIIQVAILKRSIEEGQKVFDLLRGDEPYKSHWGVKERTCSDFRVVPPRHAAQLRHQMWLAGDTMKHWIKAGLQLTGADALIS